MKLSFIVAHVCYQMKIDQSTNQYISIRFLTYPVRFHTGNVINLSIYQHTFSYVSCTFSYRKGYFLSKMGNLPLPGSKFPKSVRENPFSPTTNLLFSRLDMLSEDINLTVKTVASNQLPKI